MTLAIGLMSGTSADGVSIALGSFRGRRCRLLHYETYPYPRAMRINIETARSLRTPEISSLHFSLGRFYAEKTRRFMRRFKIRPGNVTVIGCHGQTVYHGARDARPNTLQIGEPSFLAEATGIPVVSDFRSRDIAAGGGGAPLIPFFDEYFYRNGTGNRALQNIGGIANVTWTGRSGSAAFDNGPGNCLIDWAVRHKTKGRFSYDPDGTLAAKGTVFMAHVRAMAAHPYFSRRPPKSTGQELFNARFIPASLLNERLEDVLATLTFFTAFTIYESCRRFLPRVDELIVSGGGALNRTIMSFLRLLFTNIPVRSIEESGMPAQAKEPLAFAFFALRTIQNQPNHLPAATGAKRRAVLGKITPGN